MAAQRRRLTEKEQEAMRKYVRELCDGRRHNGEIKRMAAAKFGVKPRTIEHYLTEVRNERIEESGRTVDDHRADSFHFYISVLRDKKADPRDKIKAQERIDKLLGLERPQKVESKNLDISLTPEELAKMTDEELDAFWRRLSASAGRT